MSIALVTWSGLPQLAADDRLLRAELERRGHGVAAVAWDDPFVDWQSFDAIVLRSTWDYHKRIDAFRAWLARLEVLGAPLWNPVAVVRRNLHKGYLLDLRNDGVGVVPTAVLTNPEALDGVLEAHGWPRAVVKPAVSATAFRTFVVERGASVPPGEWPGEMMVQPFLEEVPRDGEWSLIFFGGAFSHAVLKRPARGDFRVQTDFGGSVTDVVAPPHLIADARAILTRIAQPLLYARVDGVVRGGRFMLMELELTEPSLFLDRHPDAPARFADAITRTASRSPARGSVLTRPA